ncbi:acyl-CoA dehydrogenase [Bacillus sp. V3-13]|uniref:acyl-CoA dehydrogenase family protein n=1 Tax=Bacillus sp. V3-13 TaxID=2053728 RepID=UPI000C766C7B|nr:acyl-CoA dehydrogenase family protein [Bacillus sp. V3-13]PLR76763.1 acyl-CoA dehydrogenase [Bacillus sp. V3-13]
MDFKLTDEEVLIRKLARDFAEKEVRPIAKELSHNKGFPTEVYQKMGELGLAGVPYPEEYGGGGGSWLAFAIVHEEIARVDPSVANSIMGNSSVCSLLSSFGTHEQKEKWLTSILTGQKIGAIALTESNAGSDANNLSTTAKLVGDEWVINGSKTFISNSGTEITGPIIVAAVTGTDERGRKEIGTFIVPKETAGVLVGPQLQKIGFKGNDTRELTFDNCRIPEGNLLGDKAKGYRQTLATISSGRFLIAAMGVGLAQGCLDMSLEYVKERKAFGRQLSEFQNIQFKLAEIATKIELARMITYKAAVLKDKNEPFAMEASMAKLYATKSAMEIAHEAVQMHGGYGIMEEYDVSRFFGDAKVLEIVEGTNEIQKMIISRQLIKN